MKRLTAWLHRQTVHRKLLLVILTSSSASMVLAGAALFVFITSTLRTKFAEDTGALAEITAANCAGPVAFGDKESASDMITALAGQEQVVGAAILLADGAVFVRFKEFKEPETRRAASPASLWIGKNRLQQTSPIIVSGEIIGHFSLLTDFTKTEDRLLHSYVMVFAGVSVFAALVGIILGAGARRVISDPIRKLADLAAAAAEQSPASVKSGRRTSELTDLEDALTMMQGRIEAGSKLEQEIAERRRAEQALRKSEEQFRSLFENAPVGLYRSSREGRFTMANPALLRMLGYDTFEELATVDIRSTLCITPGYRAHFDECVERLGLVDETEVQWQRRDGKVIFVRESAKAIRNRMGEISYCEGCVEDITARKEAQAELQRLHRELVDASRAAGMAEVATGVLHNVGNVLNSVNVSATVLQDQLGRSKLASLEQAVALLQANLPQLRTFLETDPKGRLLPDFLIKVTQHVAAEHSRWRDELRDMKKNVEHMKVIVSLQQTYAKVTGACEPLSAAELVEDALRINNAGLERHRVQIERIFLEVPPVMVDKHKALQILVNLIQNAGHALNESDTPEKRLKLKIFKNGSGRVKIQVTDNGVGISPENLTRIFSHGFTTRSDGHGFGLHSGALAAREVGGSLDVQSDGPGRGATFTLELPIAGTHN